MRSHRCALAALGAVIVFCARRAHCGEPPVSGPHGEPIRGEPIGGAPIVASAPATSGISSVSTSNAAASLTKVVPTNDAESSKGEKFISAGFDKLAGFNVELGPESPVAPEKRPAASRKILDQVPPAVKALNEKESGRQGFHAAHAR